VSPETTFEGFDRGNAVGVRNHVLVLPSVICSRAVATEIADRVPGARAAPHDHGCGQIGADKEQTHRTYLGLGANPNVAGTVVVGLGCESVQSDDVAADLAEADTPVHEVAIQDAGGTDECIEQGVAAAQALVDEAERTRGCRGGLGDLTLGVVSGDAERSTVEAADPVVGGLTRDVVAAGGQVVTAGVERLLPHRDEAVDTAGTDGGLADLLDAHRTQPARTTRVARQAANYDFEAVAAGWGGLPIDDTVQYGGRADPDARVTLVDAPAAFEEAATGLAAAGAQVVVHATADGVPTGHPLVPVVKLSGEPETVAALPEDIDLDATTADAAALRNRVLAVADGTRSCAEEHGLDAFAVTRVGPSM
jgi:altronate dehydratase large subunit